MQETPEDRVEILEAFAERAQAALRFQTDRARAKALLFRWGTAWQGSTRSLTLTRSLHGTYLHFNQLIGKVWCQVFSFHAAPRQGLTMRGPDSDRARKSHKHRDNRLDASGLDALFAAWSAHPETRPAGIAVEADLLEVPDETWEAMLQETLKILKV